MIKSTGIRPQLIPGFIISIAVYIIASLVASGLIGVKWFSLLLPLISIIMVLELYRRLEKPFDSLAHTFFPLFYTTLPLSLFPLAAFGRTGLDSLLPHSGMIFSPGLIIGFFILLWSNDTGAYLTGISFGRHRLMERISPKKSWEGFIGGAVIALAVAWFLSGWLGVVDRKKWMIISVIISIAGTYGDLVESMLKRSMGVKDSGSVMPGHGGFLDRFDSTLISFPLVYLFITLFG